MRPPGGGRLISIGYEGREPGDLVEALRREGVSIVVDVRLNPVSRKAGMSKGRLASALGEAGIEYVHLRALGNPVDNRAGYRAGRAAARERYEAILASPEGSAAVDELVRLASRCTVAVLCVEADHSVCHRRSVIDTASRRQPRLRVTYA